MQNEGENQIKGFSEIAYPFVWLQLHPIPEKERTES